MAVSARRATAIAVRRLAWIAADAAQLRNDLTAAVKKAGSSSHGKCAAPSVPVTVQVMVG
jgi:hypothetical protein